MKNIINFNQEKLNNDSLILLKQLLFLLVEYQEYFS